MAPLYLGILHEKKIGDLKLRDNHRVTKGLYISKETTFTASVSDLKSEKTAGIRGRDYGRVLRNDDAIYGFENIGVLDALTPFDRLIRPR